jgi:2-polyprenyl-3-methyl-5-hydroxy-6-metoxy-1,4-benzoquinol methylase
MRAWHSRDASLTEWLDAPAIGESDLRRNLRDIRRINALLGWTASATRAVAALTQAAPQRAWTLLDVASGSADIPLAIAQWAKQARPNMTVVASDINPQIVAIAREQCQAMPNIQVRHLDALDLTDQVQRVDIALCTLALHHFAPQDAIVLLRNMARVARHVLVFDAVRSRMAYGGVIALTRLLRMDPMTCHDAPISVQRAYAPTELRQMARQAGLPQASVKVVFPFRLMLSSRGLVEESVYAL